MGSVLVVFVKVALGSYFLFSTTIKPNFEKLISNSFSIYDI
jgi:hypothetical protein